MYQFKRLLAPLAGPSYARLPTRANTRSESPLLPTRKDEDEDEDGPAFPIPTHSSAISRRRPLCQRILLPLIIVTGLFAVIAAVAFFMGSPAPERTTADETPPPKPPQPPPIPSTGHSTTTISEASGPFVTAKASLDALLARQSRNLAQATARYSLKTGRSPPRNFDKWFAFAKDKKCLIDEYDQVQRDFAPFYQLAEDSPSHFQDMINRGREMMLKDSKGMTTINIKDGQVHMPNYQGTAFYNDWPRTIGRFSSVLPDMDFMLNGRDEPRVVFNYREPGAREKALQLKDPEPFHIAPWGSGEWFKNHSGCNPLSTDKGFTNDASADIAFLRSSSSSDFTTDLWPLLSMTKISPCFSDILFPGQYFYDESWWSGSFAHPDNVAWADKKEQIYWRGMSNGGHIIGQNYHKFPRFRLIDLARTHKDLMEVKMTRFAETHCTTDCDRDGIIAEYDITGPQSPKEDVYKFKYLLDVDGNTFSGRFLGLMESGSLVFKSTVFDEYFNDWLRPYEHYIPVMPDLSDLVEKIQWAIDHDEEARLIQERGKQFTQRLMTDSQNDCYFAAVLLEWARLQSYAQGDSAARRH
ncbi:glycosyl transferase family 90-domain-containing protein [Roridomyces roridus]|uniref:Glycosyl transferase family 90-domain-containing protein n=1 Tax=Roridomyces roridus TaxID=1738132 RepID=A0AAD7CAV2_9AGAR|nr:glycosyl transferase family 90-domain-containing protein [Roridomyces roridus]